jgi:hypothetical protein
LQLLPNYYLTAAKEIAGKNIFRKSWRYRNTGPARDCGVFVYSGFLPFSKTDKFLDGEGLPL